MSVLRLKVSKHPGEVHETRGLELKLLDKVRDRPDAEDTLEIGTRPCVLEIWRAGDSGDRGCCWRVRLLLLRGKTVLSLAEGIGR